MGRRKKDDEVRAISENLLEQDKSDVDQVIGALMKMAVVGHNAFAAKTYLQVKGILVDKKEVDIKIDGSFFARQAIQAESELREGNYRMVEVPKKLPLLSPDVREDSGQGETRDH